MRILVYLGGRANYSSIKSVMEAFNNDDYFDLITVLGCSAVLEKFGDVSELIEKDGFTINEKVFHLVEGDSPAVMAKTAALGMLDASNILLKYSPDFVLIVGDRYEMMSFALPAAYMNIRIIHTMGGEVTGTIDESIRHALTKFSHIHFVATNKAKENVLRMGEDERFVFNVGCPRIDLVKKELENDSFTILKEYFSINKGIGCDIDFNMPFILVSQHSVTTEHDLNRQYIDSILKALKTFGMQCLVLWPNSDAGGNQISKGIRTFREHNNDVPFAFHKNLPNKVYIHLMNTCFCLIGNSSSGVREGGFIGTPVINIGTRQNTRESGENIIHTDNSYDSILKSLNLIKDLEDIHDELYGNGNASEKIVNIMKTLPEFPPIQKILKY